jgi:hypothetical protein
VAEFGLRLVEHRVDICRSSDVTLHCRRSHPSVAGLRRRCSCLGLALAVVNNDIGIK